MRRTGGKSASRRHLRGAGLTAQLAPREAVEAEDAWRGHVDATADEPRATARAVPRHLGPQWGQGLLADKAYAGFTAAQTAHGGHESTLLALYTTLRHFGGIILVSPGYTDPVEFADGNPYGVSHATGADNDSPLSRTEEDALQHLVERIVAITGQLLRGRASG